MLGEVLTLKILDLGTKYLIFSLSAYVSKESIFYKTTKKELAAF